MKGYVVDIEKATNENKNFRKVLYTAKQPVSRDVFKAW
jgi:hypothetical protein